MKLSHALFISMFVVLFAGCKQDFDITSKYREIPVVYGLLNQVENTHYLRIQKGYLIDGNATIAAGVPDSIYYPDVLTVKLIPYATNGSQLGAPVVFTRIDGNTIGLPKDGGIFANSPNWLYRYQGLLDATKSYQLQIINTTNNDTIKNQPNALDGGKGIKLVKDFNIILPSVNARLVSLKNGSNVSSVIWSAAENGVIYDLTVRFPYKEFAEGSNSQLKDTFIDIPLFTSLDPKELPNPTTPVYNITATNILGYMASHLSADATVYREFNSFVGMKFTIYGGGKELALYADSKKAQGGLASNEALPPYSNIINGAGLLSSRYFKQIDSVGLTVSGYDSLSCSSLSHQLRFKNLNGQVCQ